LAYILENPLDPEAPADLQLLALVMRFVKRWESEEGCDLANMLKGCTELHKIAGIAVREVGENGSQSGYSSVIMPEGRHRV
jgi:hypothetical protein